MVVWLMKQFNNITIQPYNNQQVTIDLMVKLING